MPPKSVDKVNQSPGVTAGEIFGAIHAVMHLIRAEQYRTQRDAPRHLTHLEGKLLEFFARRPGATLSELVTHHGRDKGQLARLIKALRTRGLLAAETDPADRRSVRLRLTRRGRAVHTVLQARLKRLTALATHGLTLADRAQLVRLLSRLRANLETR